MSLSFLLNIRFLSLKKVAGLIALVFSLYPSYGQTITIHPSIVPQAVCQNGVLASLSVTADAGGGATISQIQWFSNTSNSNTGGTLVATTAYAVTPVTDTYTPSTATDGVLYYYAEITNSLGGTVKSNVSGSVTVNQLPVVTTSNSSIICSATSTNITLTASIPSSFAWTIGAITGGITGASAGSGATINQALTNPSNVSAGTVNYIVTPTSTTGSCVGSPYTITVTVNPAPVVTTPGAKNICSGTNTNLNLTASIASTYNWTIGTITGGIAGASAGSGNTISQVLTNPSSTTSGSVQYIVIPTSVLGSCAGTPFTITVTVYPAPIVTNLSTASTCSGSGPNIALTASVASTFSWSIGTITGGITGASPGTGNNINQTLTNPSSSVDGTVEYIVTPTTSVGSCAGTPLTITVTVHPAPAVVTPGTATICSGSGTGINLTASVPCSFTWTLGTITGGITGASAGSGPTINQTLTNPSNISAGTVNYIITPTSTSNSCAGSTYTITVTVNPAPVVTTPAFKAICSGSNASINLTASIASTYTWTVGTVIGGITGASAGSGNTISQVLTNPSSSASGSVEYVVTPTSVAGLCSGSPYTITVTVNPAPIVTNLPTASTCSGSGPNIALAASVASSFNWTVGAITGGITGASAGSGATINQVLTNPSSSVAGTVNYIVTPTAAVGSCPGTPLTITVTVNPAPSLSTPVTATVCSGTGTGINLTASVASSFTWTIGTITGGITGASAGSGLTINQILTNPSSTTSGTVEYMVTPTSIGGSCVGTVTKITVTVNPAPVVTTAGTKTICSGANANINLTASIASTYTWTIGTISGGITGASPGSGNTISQVLTNPSSATPGSVEYLVTPTSVSGLCAGSPFTITVSVNPAPIVTTPSTAISCSGSSPNIALSASVPSNFTWTIGAINGGITGASAGSGTTINQILTNPSNSAAGTIEYIVTPTAVTGSCPGTSMTITVTVNPAPVVLTPNTATICSGTDPGIVLTSSIPCSFTWTIGTITGGITGAAGGSGSTISQILTNPSSTISGSVEYVVTPISTTGSCSGPTYTITVIVNPAPIVTTPAIKTICSGANTSINLAASIASTYTWTIGPVIGGITGASAGSGNTISQVLTNPSPTISGTVQYIVTPTSASGLCLGTSFPITVTVTPAPVVTNLPTAFACSGSGPNIVLTASVASSFTWTIGTITGGILGANPGSGATINQPLTNPSNSVDGTVEYIVTPTATIGSCSGIPMTITVTVRPAPAVLTPNTATHL